MAPLSISKRRYDLDFNQVGKLVQKFFLQCSGCFLSLTDKGSS